MSFANPLLLNLLWLLPLVIVAALSSARRRRRALEGCASVEVLGRLLGSERAGLRHVKTALVLLAVALLLVAVAGPRFGSHYENIHRRGVDIMFVTDVSPSMLVSDVSPNRLERAKRELLDFLAGARGDRIGLVAFAGQAFRQCPLTLDYGALEMFISELGPDAAPAPGTDLGAAIDAALDGFDYKASTDKVIVLLTDGEDNEGRGQAAARRAQAKGVRIYVYGIGKPEGGPVIAAGGALARDASGQPVISHLNEGGLATIASATGGRYVRSVTGDLDLDQLYYAGIKLATRDRDLKSAKLKVQEERFYVFVLLALALLLIEGLIRPRRSQP